MRERFAHFSRMHQGSTVSAMELLTRVSRMHQVPAVSARERLTFLIIPISFISTLSIFNWVSRDTLRTRRIILSFLSLLFPHQRKLVDDGHKLRSNFYKICYKL